MKQFFRSLLLSLFLTGVIWAAFRFFQEGTFFGPAVNRITTICLFALLAVVWYLFLANLWFHHMKRRQRVLDALAHPSAPLEQPSEETGDLCAQPAEDSLPEEPEEPEPEQAPEPPPANGPEETVFIPASSGKPSASDGWTTAPESAQRPKETSREEKARKLQQAAREKQIRRARRLEEDTAHQQQKLEQLRAAAARKKAAASKNKRDLPSSEQKTDSTDS